MKKRIALLVAVAALALSVFALYRVEKSRNQSQKEKVKRIVKSLKEFEGVVSWVYDGDTVLVKSHGVKISVRLWGIDTPEKKQPGGRDALRYLIKMTRRRKVRIKPIESGIYGRLIAKIYVKEKCINLEMIKAGYAWWYERYSKGWTAGKEAQAEAQAAKRGIWGAETPPVRPYVWRKQHR